MKLILGTAQFGLDYGVNNRRGKIPKEEAFSILDHAFRNDITFVDTADSYGDSEKVIGEFNEKNKRCLNVISKTTAGEPHKTKESLICTLERLRSKKLYGYLVHSFRNYLSDSNAWDVFSGLKAEKKVEKIGFSLYYPSELELLLKEDVGFDILQVPYSLFDQRFAGYFPLLRKKGVEVVVRSIFLQGIFFMEPDRAPKVFQTVKDKIIKLRQLTKRLEVPDALLHIAFVSLNPYIDKAVIGVDSLEHLKKNLEFVDYVGKVDKAYEELLTFKEDNEDIVVPTRWGI